jgi:hypothetical protein
MRNLVNKSLMVLAFTTLPLLADMDRCVSCHGVDFEKSALGISKIVKTMSEQEIKVALDNYKKGKGGSAKEIMIKEVNVGVDTDAMAADIYNEIHTVGFSEPNSDFIFQKRFSVKRLHAIKIKLQTATKKDMKKIISQIKSVAFSMYSYDTLLQSKVDFSALNVKKITKKDMLKTVTKVKKCVDHSFSKEEIVECRVEFFNLAKTITNNEKRKMKSKMKKAPLYKGKGAINIDKYL